MELLETEKVKTWPDKLKEMIVGIPMRVALKNAASVRGAISRTLPDSGCNMEFETETKSEVINEVKVKYLEIRRIN